MHVLRRVDPEKAGKVLADWMNSKRGPRTVCSVYFRVVTFRKDKHATIANIFGNSPVKVLREYRQSPGTIPFAIAGPKIERRLRTALSAALLDGGVYDRIRKCRRCQVWFYARREHQRFCSQRCQIAHYKSSAEWREYRKGYMRELREGHKNNPNLG